MRKPKHINKRKLRPRYRLRGKTLVATAIRELSDTSSWAPPHAPLTWQGLAARLGVSRQALATKPVIKQAFTHAKVELSRWSGDHFQPEAVVKRSLDDELAALQVQITTLKKERDQWIERWVQVEANARRHGFDPDVLFQPIQKPRR